MDAEEWLTGYRDRLAELGERAGRAQDALARAEATATSPDGAVAVTVDPMGGLRGLVLSERTARMDRAQLAAAIVATAGTARRTAAEAGIAAVVPLLGADSPAVRMMRDNLPVAPSARERR